MTVKSKILKLFKRIAKLVEKIKKIENVIKQETRTKLYSRFRVYFGLLEEIVSQNFKERHIYTKKRLSIIDRI